MLSVVMATTIFAGCANDTEDSKEIEDVDDEVYYTAVAEDTGTTALWKCDMATEAVPELLMDGTEIHSFGYAEGNIYFENFDDEHTFWCYELETENFYCVDPERHPIDSYYMHGGYVYYVNADDCGIYKMSVDGSISEYLFDLSSYGMNDTQTMLAFDVEDSVYFAFVGDDGCICVASEYGKECEMSGIDSDQGIYFDDGYLYYSAGNGTAIHIFDIEQYVITDSAEINDSIISYDSYIEYNVFYGMVLIELSGGNNEIRVIDSQTGEEYNVFDFS